MLCLRQARGCLQACPPIVLLSLCIVVAPLPALIGGWALCPGWETLAKPGGLRAMRVSVGEGSRQRQTLPVFRVPWHSKAKLAGRLMSPVLDGGFLAPVSRTPSSCRAEVEEDAVSEGARALAGLGASPAPGWVPLPAKPHQTPLPPGLELELVLLVAAAQARQTFPGRGLLGARGAGPASGWGSQQGAEGQGFVPLPRGALGGNFLSPRGTATSSPGPST